MKTNAATLLDSAAGRAAPDPPGLDSMAEEVAAYLAEHPDFLARRPELYRALTPPRRIHGENMADHMVAMVAAERARTRGLEAEMRAAIDDGRAGATLMMQVRLAVLALMRSRDVVETVMQELPALLRVESCNLLVEPGPHNQDRGFGFRRAGMLALPAGGVSNLIGRGRDARVRTEVTDAALLHTEAAPLVTRDALIRVPLSCNTPCLLALGARDAAALPVRQTTTTFAFLGRTVAAALSR
ncbi:DUF484 family protein [Falsiroseomonas sp. E2-1-a20]|uniref:DUF484 family protein n=1 Tax=Falsiroseomonas sp. E2-1-a20 TaxID=3239300 RepID=UPI003F3D6CBC